MNFSDADRRAMTLALSLARRGRGDTHPNPIVGAVVMKGGRVLGTGYHRRAGGPHAEIEALAKLRPRARGATLYVTLEPCCHSGRTGPCTTAIIQAHVARVVVGCRDANPLVDGRGIARLRRAGVHVDVGCLGDECHAQNRAFFRWIRDGRPWVTLKAAATLDGYIADGRPRPRGHIQWITGAAARQHAHELRAAHDAVLVGAGTVRADDPRLTARVAQAAGRGARAGVSSPLRVILDGRLRTPPSARLFHVRGGPRPLVLGAIPRAGDRRARDDAGRRQRALEKAGAEVLLLPGGADGRLPIARVLRALAERGVQSLLVEGGGQVHGAFVDARLVDSVAWFVAPMLGASGVAAVAGAGAGRGWDRPLRLGHLTARAIDGDILLTADVVPPGAGTPGVGIRGNARRARR